MTTKINITLNLFLILTFVPLLTFAQTQEELQKAQNYYTQGTKEYNKGDFPKAIENFTKAISIYPKSPRMFIHRGNSYIYIQKLDLALNDFEKAFELSDSLPKSNLVILHRSRGGIFSEKGEYDKAIADFTKAISLAPNSEKPYEERGNVYMKLKKFDLATADLNKSIEIKPNYVSHYNRANLFYVQRMYDKAIGDFNSSIKLNPNFADAFHGRGISNRYKGNLELALQDLTKAINLSDKIGIYYANRAKVYLKTGDFDLAVKDFTEAINFYPQWEEAFRERAEAYKKLGQKELAEKDIQKANELRKDKYDPNKGTKFILKDKSNKKEN